MKEKTALQFYKNIEKEKDKYKLVNRLFIVKYLKGDISIFIGEFLICRSVRNEGKTNKVLISENKNPQMFNKKENLTTTGLGFWKPLNIKFIESPIEDILK